MSFRAGLQRRGWKISGPLRRPAFRRLWLGMSASYAGDRLQALAQGWLVAELTGSALAVGAILAVGTLPQLLLPLAGALADRLNRRRLLIAGQLVGALATAVVAALVLLERIEVWQIYGWALVSGIVALLSRPAYKVVLTEAVPTAEIRAAVAVNSMTETGAAVLAGAGGSILLAALGLPIAFLLNTASYLIAVATLWQLRQLGQLAASQQPPLSIRQLFADLAEGLVYLARQPGLRAPLLLTFLTVLAASPTLSLLAAIVHRGGGSVVNLGMLAAASSVGAFVGAALAGARDGGRQPLRHYAQLGIMVAIALALFALLPVGLLSLGPLALIGSVLFAQAVWNTSRVREQAAPNYQARLQAVTSMAFTLGMPLGVLWAGPALDAYGPVALLAGALVLGTISLALTLRRRVASLSYYAGDKRS